MKLHAGIHQSALTFQFSKRNIVIHLQLCIDVSVLLSLLKQIYGHPRTPEPEILGLNPGGPTIQYNVTNSSKPLLRIYCMQWISAMQMLERLLKSMIFTNCRNRESLTIAGSALTYKNLYPRKHHIKFYHLW
ncbi:MAG: hypothetical protein QXI01_06855, partial [Nitrososphaerota archaeon]